MVGVLGGLLGVTPVVSTELDEASLLRLGAFPG